MRVECMVGVRLRERVSQCFCSQASCVPSFLSNDNCVMSLPSSSAAPLSSAAAPLCVWRSTSASRAEDRRCGSGVASHRISSALPTRDRRCREYCPRGRPSRRCCSSSSSLRRAPTLASPPPLPCRVGFAYGERASCRCLRFSLSLVAERNSSVVGTAGVSQKNGISCMHGSTPSASGPAVGVEKASSCVPGGGLCAGVLSSGALRGALSGGCSCTAGNAMCAGHAPRPTRPARGVAIAAMRFERKRPPAKLKEGVC